MTDLPRDTEIELAALADGSLAGAPRERALAGVRGSHKLRTALAAQKRVVELTAAVDVSAPASLQRRIEAMFTPTERERGHARARHALTLGRPWSMTPRAGFVTLAAVALIAVVVAAGLIGGPDKPSSSGLGVRQAATLTLSPATAPAPAESKTHRSQLAVAVGGVSFPYWTERFGWHSSGARKDRIGGRSLTTVFYTNREGRRIGYAIASGRAPVTSGGRVVRRWGVAYRLLSQDGATVIAWQRGGHLCVMAGRGVSARTLLSLASWGSEKSHAA